MVAKILTVMKNKFYFGLAFFFCLIFLPEMDLLAQGRSGGGPPPWAPAHGYRAKTRYVYFPDHNMYFDLQKNMYIFLSGGGWMVAATLPRVYANINLKTSRHVELDFYSENPQRNNKDHLVKHKGNSGGKGSKGGPPSQRGNGRGRN
jgi:hypothetical protein